MKKQKIISMLNDSNNEESKFPTNKWYVIDSQTVQDKNNQKNSIKLRTESIKSNLCDYSDAFILVTRDITVNADNNTDVPFQKLRTTFSMQDRN